MWCGGLVVLPARMYSDVVVIVVVAEDVYSEVVLLGRMYAWCGGAVCA